jgi:SNF family Na+-dependent transporter
MHFLINFDTIERVSLIFLLIGIPISTIFIYYLGDLSFKKSLIICCNIFYVLLAIKNSICIYLIYKREKMQEELNKNEIV